MLTFEHQQCSLGGSKLMKKALMATAAVAVVLPLAACGSTKQSLAQLGSSTAAAASASGTSSSMAPSTALSSTTTSSWTADSSPSTNASGLPDLALPSDVNLQFNLPRTSDSTQAAALQGLAMVEKAMYKATETGAVSGPLLDDFDINDAKLQIGHFLASQKQAGTTVTGTNVYYDWKFTQEDPGQKAAQITYCEDQNKFIGKNRSTGRLVPQQTGLAQIYSFKVTMVVDIHDGRWKAGYYTWTAGDKACQAAEGH